MPNQDESTDSGQASASQLAELQRQLQELQAQAQANQGTYPTSIPVGKIRKALNESKVNLTGHGDNKGQAFRAWLQSLSGLGNEFHLLKRFLKDARNECNTESDPLLTAEHDDAFLAVLKAATSGYARELLEEEETTNGSSGRDALRALEAYCTPKTYSEKLAMSCNLTHKMPMDIPSKSDPRESITKYNRECANLKRLYGIELLQVQQVGCVLRSLPSTYDELKRKLMQKSHDPGISLDELTEKIQNHWSTFLNPETNGGRANTVVHAQALAASTDARGRGTRYGAGVPCACLCTPKFTTVVQAVVAEVVAEVTSISTSRVVVAKVAEAPAVVAARTAASASFGKPRYYRKLTNVRFRPRKTNRVTFVNNQAISLLIVRRNAT